MNFDDVFDISIEREKLHELAVNLRNHCVQLEQQVVQLTAKVKTYEFLVTRIMVEQRDTSDRIAEVESVCASLALRVLGVRGEDNAEEK